MNRALKDILVGGGGAATPLGDVGLAVARVGFGFMIGIGHGWSKIFPGAGAFGPPQMLIDGVRDLGFPAPALFAWLAALAECLGGILLAAGIFTRPAALLLCINMSVAAFMAHARDPLFATGTGASKEFALLYLFPFFMFLLTGAGRWSVDAWLRKKL